MNVNRIFSDKPNYGEDGEITLSGEYKKDNGESFSVLKPIKKVDASLIMVCGVPFNFSNGEVTISGPIMSKYIMLVFDLSCDELSRLSMGDYMKLTNHIADGFSDE